MLANGPGWVYAIMSCLLGGGHAGAAVSHLCCGGVVGCYNPHKPHWWLLQANNKQWTKEIAQNCISYGLGLVCSGWGQPPLRPCSLRVMHKFDQTRDRECIKETCM